MSNVVIRASSLGTLFDCPARWEAIHLKGQYLPSTGKAQLGKAVHASTAVFDQSTIDNAGITIADAAVAAIDVIHKPDEDVNWEGESPNDAEKIALSLHGKYCREVAPMQIYKAVEVKCERLDITDLGISLTGTTDRIRETENGFSICDLKTGKAAVGADGTIKTGGHAYQMGVYELLAEQASGVPIKGAAQIIGMNTAKTPASQRIGVAEIHGAREILVGDGETPGILEMAATMIKSGNFFGNPKSMMCHKNYCPNFNNCKYRR